MVSNSPVAMPRIELVCINLLCSEHHVMHCIQAGKLLIAIVLCCLAIKLSLPLYLHIVHWPVWYLHPKCSMIMYVTCTSGNDTHCQLLLLWIIPARRPDTVQCYITYMNNIHIYLLPHEIEHTVHTYALYTYIQLLHYKLIRWDGPIRRAGTNASA